MSRTVLPRCVLPLSVLVVAVALIIPPLRAATPSGVIEVAEAGVTVPDAWARASPGAATTGAAYVTLRGGAQPDQLISVSTPIASSAQVHETMNSNGVMQMRPVAAVPIAPNQSVTFAPGGIHIMLMGLKQPLKAGQSFPLTLTFAHAAPVEVNVPVRALGNASNSTMGDDMGMPMH